MKVKIRWEVKCYYNTPLKIIFLFSMTVRMVLLQCKAFALQIVFKACRSFLIHK